MCIGRACAVGSNSSISLISTTLLTQGLDVCSQTTCLFGRVLQATHLIGPVLAGPRLAWACCVLDGDALTGAVNACVWYVLIFGILRPLTSPSMSGNLMHCAKMQYSVYVVDAGQVTDLR